MRYKLLYFLLTVLILSSCKKNNGETKPDTTIAEPTPSDNDSPEPTQTPDEIPIEKQKLTILVEKSADIETLHKITTTYKQLNQTDIEIKTTDDFYGKVSNLANDPEKIDLVYCKPYTKEFTELNNQGCFEDINLLSETEQMNIFQNENVKNAVTIDGKIPSFPITANVDGIIINKKLFADYGIKIPETRAEMFQVSEQIKNNGMYTFQGYRKPIDKFLEQQMTLLGISDGSLEPFFRQTSADGAGSKNAELMQYKDFIEIMFHNIDYSTVNFDYEQALNEFASARAFMFLGTAEDLLTALYINPELDLEFIQFPNDKNATPIQVLRGLSVVSGSEKRKLALDFMNFFNRVEIGDYVVNQMGAVSLLPNTRTALPQLKNINDSLFESNIFINNSAYLDNDFRLLVNDLILKFINTRDINSFITEFEIICKRYYQDLS